MPTFDIQAPRKRLAAQAIHYAGQAVVSATRLFFPPPKLGPADDYPFKKILIIRVDHIGDVVMTTPLFRELKERYPNARLSVLVGSWSKDLLAHHPLVDETIIFDCPWWAGVRASSGPRPESFLKRYRLLLKKLKEENFDLVLEPRGDIRHMFFFGYLPGIPYRVGYARTGGDYLWTHLVDFRPELHHVDKNLAILEPLGIKTPKALTEIVPGPIDQSRVADRLQALGVKANERIVVIHPGARTQVKKWPASRFRATAQELAKLPGVRIVLVGGKEEMELASEVCTEVPGAQNLAGKLSLLELVSLFHKSSLVVCNDSGPMHLAVAAGTRVLAIFGPTDPKIYGYENSKCRWLHRRLDCCPCHFENQCPISSTPTSKCLDELPATEVVESAKALLQESAR